MHVAANGVFGQADFGLLAEIEGPIAKLKRPIVLLVDYVNHKNERPTIEESAAGICGSDAFAW